LFGTKPSSALQSDTIVLWTANVAPADVHGDFARVPDTSAAGGYALLNPDRGGLKISPALADPANYIELAFTASAGVPYHLWLRLKAQNDSTANDSFHVQFSDTVTATGEETTRIGTTSSLEVVLQDGSGAAEPRGWGWTDNGWGSPGAPIYFANSGTHILRIQQREDGPSVDQVVISSGTYFTVPPGSRRDDTTVLTATQMVSPSAVSAAGTIVLRAADVSAASTFGNWRRVADATASGGADLRNPDLGETRISPALASPGTYFETTFSASAGQPYHIWLRMKADNDSTSNDSVHVQFNDSITSAGFPIARIGTINSAAIVLQDGSAGQSPQGWGWADNGFGALGAHVYFEASGTHTLRIQQREDGATVDQIVISPDAYLTTAPGPRRDDTTILAAATAPSSTNQPPLVALSSPVSGSTFMAPATIALVATASDPEGRLARVEFYDGSTRLGTATTPPYAFSWTSVPAGTYSLTALAIDADGGQTTSAAVNVTVGSASFTAQDIGAPAITGSATLSNSVYTITAGGADIWNSADQFHYVYQPFTGDLDVVARVGSLQYTNEWSKAGIMVREALTAGARHASTFVTPARGIVLQWRSDPDSSSFAGQSFAGIAPAWLRLVRTGNRFESFSSTDGFTWTSNGSTDITMAATVYVGLAVTSHDPNQSVTATIDRYSVKVPDPALNQQPNAAANQPPTVSLTAPANNLTLTAPATIDLAATASDPENRMARVEFYNGSTLLGTDTTSPYTFSWSSVPAGTYSLTALAIDADGGQTRSSPVTVTVGAATSRTWTVAFTASADHDLNVTSYRFDVFASGANPASATPITTANLGKPTPDANREIRVDETTVIGALTAGNYLATVTAIGPGGQTRSASYTFTR
jgi:hypothetical protein